MKVYAQRQFVGSCLTSHYSISKRLCTDRSKYLSKAEVTFTTKL